MEKYTTEIIADTMQMLGSRQGSGQADERPAQSAGVAAKPAAQSSGNTPGNAGSGFNDFEDDIPF